MLRVLLLDDDLAFAAEARGEFAAAGILVEVLREGAAAVERAAAEPPDVVIVSAELPGINGFRLCSRLKKEHDGLPVVLTFTEGSASSVASHQRLPSRADAYVPRSVAIHELVTRVRGLVPRQRSETPASPRRRSTTPAAARARKPRASARPPSGPPVLPVAPPPPRAAPHALSSHALPPSPRMPSPPRAVPPPPRSPSHALPPRPPPPSPSGPGLPPRTASPSGPGLSPRPAPPSIPGVAPRPPSPPALPPPPGSAPRSTRGGAVHPEGAATGVDEARRHAGDALHGEHEKLQALLEAARADADVLRRALEEARASRDDGDRQRAGATRALETVAAELAEVRADRDDKLRELDASRARIGRLEQQVIDMEREMYGASSERVDHRLVVLQKAAEASRVERDELRRRLEETQRALEAERALEAQRVRPAEPPDVALQVAAALEQTRREHALEMTRLRGEHAAVVFQLRHELAALRGTPKGGATLRPGSPADAPVVRRSEEEAAATAARANEQRQAAERALAEATREHEEMVATLRDRHARELGAMRSNIEVAIRRIESLERELGDATGGRDRPSLAAARPPVPKRDKAGR